MSVIEPKFLILQFFNSKRFYFFPTRLCLRDLESGEGIAHTPCCKAQRRWFLFVSAEDAEMEGLIAMATEPKIVFFSLESSLSSIYGDGKHMYKYGKEYTLMEAFSYSKGG